MKPPIDAPAGPSPKDPAPAPPAPPSKSDTAPNTRFDDPAVTKSAHHHHHQFVCPPEGILPCPPSPSPPGTMTTPLAEHLVLVTNAASRAARECTALILRLERSDDLIALRNALPGLNTSALEVCGICYSLGVAFENLDLLPPSRPDARRHWVSDHYYLTTCAHVLDGICVGARIVPGFEAVAHGDGEASTHDEGSKVITANGNPAPAAEPLTSKRVQFFLLDLARLKGRLRTGSSALDMYSLHFAVSQPESIKEAPQNGSPASHSPSSDEATPPADLTSKPSVSSTQLCLE
ncbi:hypothetical protein IMZ48_05030, partial [Candidatus Bathyarchaeota archaeon]|nr:hypothetical protein [Candidatus Bathyarchaeota archaeon]